jgi:hypothetical protein
MEETTPQDSLGLWFRVRVTNEKHCRDGIANP